jgi:hypothetical protein
MMTGDGHALLHIKTMGIEALYPRIEMKLLTALGFGKLGEPGKYLSPRSLGAIACRINLKSGNTSLGFIRC